MTNNNFIFIIAVISAAFGIGYLEGLDQLEIPFLSLGMLVCIFAVYLNLKTNKDILNPVFLILVIGLVRYGIPSFLLFWTDPNIYIHFFAVEDVYWRLGRALALLGLLSIIVGSLFTPRIPYTVAAKFANKLSSIQIGINYAITANLFLILGLLFLLYFLIINYGNPLQAFFSGIIRDPTYRVPETSRYSFLANFFLYSGSLVLQIYLLLIRRVKWWKGLLPGILPFVFLSPTGGRVGALTPLIFGLLILWYKRKDLKINYYRLLTILAIITLFFIIYAAFISHYRGGGGIERGLEVLTWIELRKYIVHSFWNEIGMLHPYTLAVYLGPGIIEGKSFVLLGGIFTEVFLGMSGVRPGQFIVEAMSYSTLDRIWGIHTGLIVDLFMNVNLTLAMIGGIIYGIILNTIYKVFLNYKKLPSLILIYILVVWNMIWSFYESMIVISNLFYILIFLLLMMVIEKILPKPRYAKFQYYR